MPKPLTQSPEPVAPAPARHSVVFVQRRSRPNRIRQTIQKAAKRKPTEKKLYKKINIYKIYIERENEGKDLTESITLINWLTVGPAAPNYANSTKINVNSGIRNLQMPDSPAAALAPSLSLCVCVCVLTAQWGFYIAATMATTWPCLTFSCQWQAESQNVTTQRSHALWCMTESSTEWVWPFKWTQSRAGCTATLRDPEIFIQFTQC